MGRFSRDTYKLLKQPDASGFVRDYRNVRLQMGVPLVDADWNELEDIRKHELRSLVATTMGNGLPEGNNGFEIFNIANVVENQRPTFTIRAGSILIDGTMVTNPTDIAFEAQEYYGEGAGLQRATQRGVAPIAPMAILADYRVDNVYLEVWEREVSAAEDPRLMDNVLLEETATRIRLEWAVRVITGDVPASTETHKRLWLAELTFLHDGAFWCVPEDKRPLAFFQDRDRIVSVPPFGHTYQNYGPFNYDSAGAHAWTSTQAIGMIINVNLPHRARLHSIRVGGVVRQGTFEARLYRVAFGGEQAQSLAYLNVYNSTLEPMDLSSNTWDDWSQVNNEMFYYHILVTWASSTSTSYCRIGGFQITLQP